LAIAIVVPTEYYCTQKYVPDGSTTPYHMFEPGPWDKAHAVDGAHVFSKKRKLLYGDEHNDAAFNEDGKDFAPRELHKLHSIWRKGALKMMHEMCSRQKGEVKLNKVPARTFGGSAWPGDLGKHHALVEEMVELGVLSIHQNDAAVVYALIHRDKLAEAMQKYVTTHAVGSATGHPSPSLPEVLTPNFTVADRFEGARSGYVFKLGDQGVGYYRDQPFDDDIVRTNTSGEVIASESLPEGWVKGAGPNFHP